MRTVAIVGVGLIGGSFALALRKAGFDGRVIGVSSPRAIDEALRHGVIDEALPLAKAAAQADLLYLSQPILRIVGTVSELDAQVKPGALVTDAGSTKAEIVRAAQECLRRACFLGGHPMAGKESRGAGAADADLFQDRPYVLTPDRESDLDEDPFRGFVAWVRRIGARPIILSPDRHDRLVALASHLPQLLSTSLAASLEAAAEAGEIQRVAGPGLTDMTRLALSPFDIWADILATNQAPIRRALGAYIQELERLREALDSPDVAERFRAAATFARRLRPE